MAVTSGLGERDATTSMCQARNPADISLGMVPMSVDAPASPFPKLRLGSLSPKSTLNKSSTEKLEETPAALASLHDTCWEGTNINHTYGFKQHINCIVLLSLVHNTFVPNWKTTFIARSGVHFSQRPWEVEKTSLHPELGVNGLSVSLKTLILWPTPH